MSAVGEWRGAHHRQLRTPPRAAQTPALGAFVAKEPSWQSAPAPGGKTRPCGTGAAAFAGRAGGAGLEEDETGATAVAGAFGVEGGTKAWRGALVRGGTVTRGLTCRFTLGARLGLGA